MDDLAHSTCEFRYTENDIASKFLRLAPIGANVPAFHGRAPGLPGERTFAEVYVALIIGEMAQRGRFVLRRYVS